MSVEPGPELRTEPRPPLPRLGLIAMIIFGSRWLQLPLYFGLIVAQCVYIVLFLKEVPLRRTTGRGPGVDAADSQAMQEAPETAITPATATPSTTTEIATEESPVPSR